MDALLLGAGPVLAPVDIEPPYTLHATVSAAAGECYAGFCFRGVDHDNYESLYVAPHAGGTPEAIQYDPVINGSNTWQVFAFPRGMAQADLQRDGWQRLSLDVWSDVARLRLDDQPDGAVFRLQGGHQGRGVGLWGYLPSYASDFGVDSLSESGPITPHMRPFGMIEEWLVARVDERGRSEEPREAKVEQNGALCLNRLWRAEPEARALAASRVEVPEAFRDLRLELDYSDRARAWLDGNLVHEGQWCWDPSRGADGRIRPGRLSIPLDVRSGTRVLAIELTNLEPFGWGLAARVVADGLPCSWALPSWPPAPYEEGLRLVPRSSDG